MALSTYSYTTDGGTLVKVRLDSEKAIVGGFQAPDANDESPVVPGFIKRMRGVYAENTESGSNTFFPMATPDEAAYAANSSTSISYKGINYSTCSRKGERIFYGADVAEPTSNAAPAPSGE